MMYLLFAGNDYYACGGMNDFIGVYDSVDKAKTAFSLLKEGNEWAHIADSKDYSIVCRYWPDAIEVWVNEGDDALFESDITQDQPDYTGVIWHKNEYI